MVKSFRNVVDTSAFVTPSSMAAASAANLATMQAQIPLAANAAPPGVGTTSDKGAATRYALADHTHATSVRRKKIAVSVSAAATEVSWTFATAYTAGISPVCTATVENASGATQPYVVNLKGPATNTGVTFIVFKGQAQTLGATLLAIAGMVINGFGATVPTGVVLNCQAGTETG